MDEKTLAKIEDPKFFPELLEHITSGGSLPDTCQLLQIRYSQVFAWIYEDSSRSRQYELALKARSEWFIQTILNELKDIAVSDIRQLYNTDGTLKDPKDWPTSASRAVQAVETIESQVDPTSTKRVKFWDKLKALELLGKNLKMFKDHVEHTADESLEALISRSMTNEPKEGKETPQGSTEVAGQLPPGPNELDKGSESVGEAEVLPEGTDS